MSENLLGNIERLRSDLEHSVTEENAKFLEGAIYGLDLAIGAIKATNKAERKTEIND